MITKLQTAVDAATKKVCAAIAKQFPAEDIYGFALYTSGEYSYVGDSLMTISGLKTVAEKYLQEKSYKKEWKTVDVAMQTLKWSPCDAPDYLKFEKDFRAANKLLIKLRNLVDTDSPVLTSRQVHEVFTQALLSIRTAGIFADTVILNVLMGDQSDEERFLNAEPLNSKPALARFRKELEVDAKELTSLRKNRWKPL